MKNILYILFYTLFSGLLTPLHAADEAAINELMKGIIEDSPNLVTTYLEQGHSPNVTDSNDNPALVVATYYKRSKIVKLLLEHKADVNQINAAGMTPLMVAVTKQSTNLMEMLLEYAADVNRQNPESGYTALMYATQKNDTAAVELLLKHKADLFVRSKNGKTAYDIAKEANYASLINLLTPATLLAENNKSANINTQINNLVDFIDIDTFDKTLVESMAQAQDSIEIGVVEPFSVNNIPERLNRWLSVVAENQGTVEIKTPLESRLLSLVNPPSRNLSTFAYDLAKNYNVIIFYEPHTKLVRKIQFTRKADTRGIRG